MELAVAEGAGLVVGVVSARRHVRAPPNQSRVVIWSLFFGANEVGKAPGWRTWRVFRSW
jgi:hypothetical protein